MTIQQLLSGVRVNWIQVNIIEQITATKFIVGDATGLALMEIPEEFSKYVEVGKGIKLVKPSKIGNDRIACDKRFTPMKTKEVKIKKPKEETINSLRNLGAVNIQQADDSKFKDIENTHDNDIIAKILVYVVTVSRPIESKYFFLLFLFHWWSISL